MIRASGCGPVWKDWQRYQPLDQPTPSEQAIWTAQDPGEMLQGHNAAQIAASFKDPSSAIAQGAVGAANTLVAGICNITGQQPASVCSVPDILNLEKRLTAS